MLLLHIAFLECCRAAMQEGSSKCHTTCWLLFPLLLLRPTSPLMAFLRAIHLLQASQIFYTQPQFSSQPEGMKHSLDLGMSAVQFHLGLICCLERPGWMLPECLFLGHKCLLLVLKMRIYVLSVYIKLASFLYMN